MRRLLDALEELWIALFAWVPTPLGVLLRAVAYKPLFAACGLVRMEPGVTLKGCRNMRLAGGVRIGKGCFVTAGDGSLEMGADAALSPCVHVGADGGRIVIGAHVAVGPGTVIRAANHRYDRDDTPIMRQGHSHGEVIIEDDVWIAANCTITPDVRIGRGAIVGAGAVVTRSVAPFSTKFRFSPSCIGCSVLCAGCLSACWTRGPASRAGAVTGAAPGSHDASVQWGAL